MLFSELNSESFQYFHMNSSVAYAGRSPLNSVKMHVNILKKGGVYNSITEFSGNLDQTSSGYSHKKISSKNCQPDYSTVITYR